MNTGVKYKNYMCRFQSFESTCFKSKTGGNVRELTTCSKFDYCDKLLLRETKVNKIVFICDTPVGLMIEFCITERGKAFR